jgi:DNA-binding GntR family transcriptional regulator
MRVTRGAAFEKPTTLAMEIARHVREQIMSGALAAGERVNETRQSRRAARPCARRCASSSPRAS